MPTTPIIRMEAGVMPGSPHPLGARWDGAGVNFALFSAHAEAVELCLFDPTGAQEVSRIRLPEYTNEVWHCYLPDARPGLLYGYRVYGPYDPANGHRFNHHKLLLDPYAKALKGPLRWSDAHFGYRMGSPREDLSFDRRENARGMPKCVVVEDCFSWGNDRPPRTPWEETVVLEANVRGLTMRHPGVEPKRRGTFAALSSPPVIDYLAQLGISAIELLPVHAFVDDRHLLQQGLRNYWGYNSIGFFAPDPRFLLSGEIGEFKTMVKRLHEAGIEVILDVVFNHTAEGNQLGPTLCFRGIDNASYYRLADDRRYYLDVTGTGNTLNLGHPRVLQLVLDSLRYWVTEMHVDGFRFDLAVALAREPFAFDPGSSFLDAISQDPVLAGVKLIAEPWDCGHDGYHLGGFPPGWAEWNGAFRDTVRRFWRGDEGLLPELASRMTGSSDIFGRRGRRPWSSINFVTCHDGFTLQDLVSYNDKHNEANGEGNRDGSDDNLSWNCGVEGNSEEEEVLALRDRQKRNFLATLLLSLGVPMLLAGDEHGRSQDGNNNAYCQDNELSWLRWTELRPEDERLGAFVRSLIRLRRTHSVFSAHRHFRGETVGSDGLKDIAWITPEGREQATADWHNPVALCFGYVLGGAAAVYYTPGGQRVTDESFLVMMNAYHQDVPFTIPELPTSLRWELLVDTSLDSGLAEPGFFAWGGDVFPLKGRSFALFINRAPLARPGSAVPGMVGTESEPAPALSAALSGSGQSALVAGLTPPAETELAPSLALSLVTREHIMPFGGQVDPEGTRFRLWAPAAPAVELVFEDGHARPMEKLPDGWFELISRDGVPGIRYRFRIGERLYPDPASRYQPDGPLEASELVDPQAYEWADAHWQGVPWEEVVLYEIHTGTFSERGDFEGVLAHLDHLVELGVTAIELMPVAEAPGRWNWGYDGTLPYAVETRYGGPNGLKRLVDGAHQRGLAVLLDVVYNHLGPEGNFLGAYAPEFFSDRHATPWGPAINFDGPNSRPVREFFIHNALFWLEEYHLDGLRFDAVEAIVDDSEPDLIVELGRRVRQRFPDRPIHLILENGQNRAAVLGAGSGGRGPFTAQWNDDFHHPLRVLLHGARGGYYEDYADDPIGHLARALAEGFSYQGEPSSFRGGRPRGQSTAGLPPTAFVSYIQNHDQIGNHAHGLRISRQAPPQAIRAALAVLLLSPHIPLLFMGEEWQSEQPFPFFCDFTPELGEAVRRGRLEEFAGFPEFADPESRALIPDPLAEETVRSAVLDWSAPGRPEHRHWLLLTRDLLSRRRDWLVPLLKGAPPGRSFHERWEDGCFRVEWRLAGGARWELVANLSGQPVSCLGAGPRGRIIYRTGELPEGLPAWYASFSLLDDPTGVIQPTQMNEQRE